ncbi:Replication factor C subunit 5, partial [Ophiophagus hannah]
VEKYRPQTLGDLISHEDILNTSKYSIAVQILIFSDMQFTLSFECPLKEASAALVSNLYGLWKGFKLVILDEADAMTQDAQNALRRALQSRCTRFRFGPLTPELMVPRLKHVIEKENVDVSDDGMKALVTLSNGDMRRSLNILQVRLPPRYPGTENLEGLGFTGHSNRDSFVCSSRHRLATGTNEKIQLGSLVAAFQVTRDLIAAEA